ncbi:MAG: Gfo/Idh/MocA family oxidoreductase [Fimbriimonadaceae bacterium]|nr:Gfo/Idh/MocA family oxidoreductase [Fimbriimonadaceae bacterium]
MRPLAFLGCAHIHTPAFVDSTVKRGFPVRGVWDHDAARAQKNADKLGCPVRTMDEILGDAAVEAVVICSETNRHEEIVLPAVEAGKHVFIEKPIGLGARDASIIADAVTQASVTFQTGYMMRGEARVRRIKQLIDDGSLGTITRARACVSHNGALGGWFDGEWRWMADVSQAGIGGFGDLGTHALDLLLWLFGEVDRVTGCIANGTARYPDCDEVGEAILHFKSGVIATLMASWDDHSSPNRLEVSGTGGHATLYRNELYLTIPEKSDGQTAEADFGDPAPAGFNAFLDWCEGKPAELVDIRHAAYSCKVTEAIYRAASEQTWVKVG